MDPTETQMLRELYTVMLGAPGTTATGYCGKIDDVAKSQKEIVEELKKLNGNVRSNTTWRKAICWTIGIIAMLLGFSIGGIIPP